MKIGGAWLAPGIAHALRLLYACPRELTTEYAVDEVTPRRVAGKRSGGDVACGVRRPF
jgi:hypothetical protein